MNARVTFWLPSIHARKTGGNIYNRRVLDDLGHRIEPRILEGGALPDAPGGVWLVDSLLLREHGEALLARARGHARCVLVAHYLSMIDPASDSSPEARREAELLGRFDGVIATSPFCASALHARGVPADRVFVVPPRLDARYGAPPPARTRGPAATLRILTVANLLEAKGHLVLLDALESLDAGGADWSWSIAGERALDPAFADRFADRAARSPIAARIRLLGPVDPGEITRLYDASDVLALASRFETCSIVTMEAMARGLPVVAFRTGGLRDLVPAASLGAISPDRGAAGLRAALARLLTDGDARTVEGARNLEAAREFIARNEGEAPGRRLVEVLDRITQARGAEA